MLRIFIGLVLFGILLALDWRLAALCLLLYAAFWLFTLPFRILGMIYYLLLWLLTQLLYFPARLLGLTRSRKTVS